MRKLFLFLFVLFGLGSVFLGFSSWYTTDIQSPTELSLLKNTERPIDGLSIFIFVVGMTVNLMPSILMGFILSIPSNNEISDQQVIENSKNIPEVQAFLAKYPNATNYVDRSGSFLLKYSFEKPYKLDHWNYDDEISLRLFMYEDGNPHKMTVSCSHDNEYKTTERILEYLDVENCIREPIFAEEKSKIIPLCSPPKLPISIPSEQDYETHEWEEIRQYYTYQRFADEVHHRGIMMESDCMEIKTGKAIAPHSPHFTMCSVIDSDDGPYYLNGHISYLDVGYFHISNETQRSCDDGHDRCLCQFDK